MSSSAFSPDEEGGKIGGTLVPRCLKAKYVSFVMAKPDACDRRFLG